MPARRRSSRTKGPRKPPSAATCLYLGCFIFDEPGDPDRTGSFQILVEAGNPEQAVDRCRARLRWLRKSTTLFDRPATVLLNALIQLNGSFERGLLVNWESMDTPPQPDVRLLCAIPEQTDHEVRSFGMKNNKKHGEVEEDDPFIDFGGRKARRALTRANSTPLVEPARSAQAATSRLPPISTLATATANTRATKHSTAVATKAQRERRAVLAATLDELRSDGNEQRKSKEPGRAK